MLIIVGEFCYEQKITLPIPFEAASFTMQVQTLERSLIDKVFAICDYRLQGIKERESRHLYDISKLMSVVKIDKQLISLIDDVRKERMKSKNNPSAQYSYDIHKILKQIIKF